MPRVSITITLESAPHEDHEAVLAEVRALLESLRLRVRRGTPVGPLWEREIRWAEEEESP
jgi:hypothetical protein